MRTISVAKKDFKDTRRTKTLWIVVFLLLFLGSLMAYVFEGGPAMASDTERFKQAYLSIIQITSILIPIVAIVATYLAIAGERERGSIKFMLSLPNTRRDVFVGKLASRLITVGVSLLLMFGVAALILAFRFDLLPLGFPLGYVAGTTAMTILYALSFVTISLALSAAVTSRTRAISGAVGAYFGLVVFYVFPLASVTDVVRWLHHDLLGLSTNKDLYQFVEYTSPFTAFQKGLNLALPTDMEYKPFKQDRVPDTARQTAGSGVTENPLASIDLPFYLSDEFALAIFAFWIVVPLAIGYWRFERAELG